MAVSLNVATQLAATLATVTTATKLPTVSKTTVPVNESVIATFGLFGS